MLFHWNIYLLVGILTIQEVLMYTSHGFSYKDVQALHKGVKAQCSTLSVSLFNLSASCNTSAWCYHVALCQRCIRIVMSSIP